MKSVNIKLNLMTDGAKFVQIVGAYPYDMDLRSGRHVVDAKSILGIFSLDWSKPVTMEIYSDDCDDLLAEIKAVKAACHGKLLKVIIEPCLLTDDEKIKMCEIVTASGADYIKTSTGFGGGGATREDVALFAKHVGPNVKIKAAGGIANLQDAEDFINLGASRLGTSRIVKAVKAMEK